jgi:hypothetical protein
MKQSALTLADFTRRNRRPGATCELTLLAARLSPDELRVLAEAFANPATQATAIHSVLRERFGYRGGRLSIQVHRGRGCQSCRHDGRPWAKN